MLGSFIEVLRRLIKCRLRIQSGVQGCAARLVRAVVRGMRVQRQARLFDDYVAALPRRGRADLARLHMNQGHAWFGLVYGLLAAYAGDFVLSELAALQIDRLSDREKAAIMLRWLPRLSDADLLRTMLVLRARSRRVKAALVWLLGL